MAQGSSQSRGIRRARPNEVDEIRSLIVESMGYWDHSPEYLAEAEELMSLDAGDLARGHTVGTEPSGIAGEEPLTLMEFPVLARKPA